MNEIGIDAFVSINTALRQSIRTGFKMRTSPLLRSYLKKDIATLRTLQNSTLWVRSCTK